MVIYTREDEAAYTAFAHAFEQVLSGRAANRAVEQSDPSPSGTTI